MDKYNMVLPRITYSGVDALENLRQVVAGCKKAAIFTDKGILGAGLVDLPQEIFWQRMEAGQNPKTSQPSPDAFLREFEAAKDAGDSVVCILISSALSGTMQSALIAAGMVEDLDIALVDSLTATAGQRLLVQEACRLRDAGNESAQDVAAAVRQLVPRIRIAACLDTLSYLARGGRIPKAAADLGKLVNLKPLVALSPEGRVAMAGKAIAKTVSRSFGRPRRRAMPARLTTRFPSGRPSARTSAPAYSGWPMSPRRLDSPLPFHTKIPDQAGDFLYAFFSMTFRCFITICATTPVSTPVATPETISTGR